MGIRSKALVAAGTALAVSVLSAPSAHADAFYYDEVQANFTFTRSGRAVTCTVVGGSGFNVIRVPGGYINSLFGGTELRDSDAACSAAVRSVGVDVRWGQVRDEPPFHSLRSSAPNTGEIMVGTTLADVPPPGYVDAFHTISFACDQQPDGRCSFSLETSPK
jgi:hypothetical protein